MTLGDVVDIAVSGLLAQRSRLATTASNLANAQTTRTPEGGPYQRRDPVFTTARVSGPFASHIDRSMRKVEISRIALDSRPPVPRDEPGHPDANEDGVVYYPRINQVEEMTNMVSATRSFQLNLFTLSKVRAMSEAAMRIGS